MLPLVLLRIRNTPGALGLNSIQSLIWEATLKILKDQETADLISHITKLTEFHTEICEYPIHESMTSSPLHEPSDLVMVKTILSNSPNVDYLEGTFFLDFIYPLCSIST